MKNKRWKREAKRMKAYCSEEGTLCCIGGMKICEFYDRCNQVCFDCEPCNISLRELEIRCKNIYD